MAYTAAILTVSDRASSGVYDDASGPALAAFLAEFVKHLKSDA